MSLRVFWRKLCTPVSLLAFRKTYHLPTLPVAVVFSSLWTPSRPSMTDRAVRLFPYFWMGVFSCCSEIPVNAMILVFFRYE